MRLFNFLMIIFIISLISCKKDNDYPIIEPGSYFPVYPDSFWKYLVDDSIIIMDSTNDSYCLHHYQLTDTYDEYSEYSYVPFYNSSDLSPLGYTGAIYKYGRYVHNSLTPSQVWPFLSETIGYSFSRDPVSQYPSNNELFTVKAKVFNGQDSVLIQEATYFKNNYPQFTSSSKRYQEYIKGVGLAKDIVYDTITHDTISKKILVDYFISYKKDL
jgi:hypothetical protein